MYTLKDAIQVIREFWESEYKDTSEVEDLNNIGLAYTTLGDDEIPIQVSLNLNTLVVTTEVDGKVVKTEQYDSLDMLMELFLSHLDFDELVSGYES